MRKQILLENAYLKLNIVFWFDYFCVPNDFLLYLFFLFQVNSFEVEKQQINRMIIALNELKRSSG